MKDDNKILILLGLLGFGAYTYFKSKKSTITEPQDDITPPSPDPVDPKPKEPTYNPLEDKNSLQYKIAIIQRDLGTTPDGIAGTVNSNTHKAFEKKYGLDKGLINASNIEYYLQKIRNKKTKDAAKEIIGDAQTIKNAYEHDANSNLIVRIGGSFNVMEYDKARKVYVSTGVKKGYTSNSPFITPLAYARSRVSIVTPTTSGNLIIKVNPVIASEFLLSVPAGNLIVK